MHSLQSQLNLSEAKSQKRFKGCYLLESVKVKITDTGWPVRIATIKDVQGHNTIELRLLGNQFLAINHFVGDYVQLEAAIKRYRNGQFFYLAWYEPVTGLLMESVKKGLKAVEQINREACLQTLKQRVMFFESKQEQSLCFNILKNFSQEFSTFGLQNLCQRLAQLDDNQLLVDLVHQVEKQSDDISSIGKLLNQLSNKLPYKIWEEKLLGI
jgi:hypothetical protein